MGFIFNAYNIYKTLCKEVKMNPMNHYEFFHIPFLENIESTNCGVCNHLVFMFQRLGIRKRYGYTPTTMVKLNVECVPSM